MQGVLERLAYFVIRRRRWIVLAWIGLTLFGLFTTTRLSDRWFESFSIPGYSAYEANQRTLKTFGTGEQAPLVAVFHSKGDVTKEKAIAKAIAKGAAVNPGSRVELVLLDGLERVRLEGPAHDVRRDLPARPPGLQLERAHQASPCGGQGRGTAGSDRPSHGP